MPYRMTPSVKQTTDADFIFKTIISYIMCCTMLGPLVVEGLKPENVEAKNLKK